MLADIQLNFLPDIAHFITMHPLHSEDSDGYCPLQTEVLEKIEFLETEGFFLI
jgi:hypothetical protein